MRYIILALIMICIPAVAMANSCYSSAEAEAEQGIRIHSELMVIGLNCTHIGARSGIDLYGQYRQFTADHGELIATYEKILLNHYRENGVSNPESKINTIRTGYANKISQDAASIRPDIFCSQYAKRVLSASKMDQEGVRQWAATFYPSHPVSKPLCNG